MKRTYIAAAALLLGTSAYAWAPSSEPVAQDAKDPMAVEIVKPTVAEVVAAKDEAAQEQTAAWSGEEEAVLQPASLETWSDQPEPEADSRSRSLRGSRHRHRPGRRAGGRSDRHRHDRRRHHRRRRPGGGGRDQRGRPHPAPGDAQLSALRPGAGRRQLHPALRAGRAHRAGELEPADRRPGRIGRGLCRGRDPDETATTAVGGPYEPVEGSETAMAGDGNVDAAAGETAEVELASADSAQYAGMGGPIAETGYPPCSPGPGDDRCIQLYEPGVTGAGN